MSESPQARIVPFPSLGHKAITRLVDDAFTEGEQRILAEQSKTARRRGPEQIAYDLFLLREEAVHDIWIGSPVGLDLDDSNRDCVLCERPLDEGPAAGWYARNSGGEWLMAHSMCASRAVRWGTAPGAHSTPARALLYVLPPEMVPTTDQYPCKGCRAERVRVEGSYCSNCLNEAVQNANGCMDDRD